VIRNRSLLVIALSILLLPIMACSKSEDIPVQREIFGTPPTILNATVNVNETETLCDLTDELNVWLGQDVLTSLNLGLAYTELFFDVHVTDADSVDSVPGEDNILAVTATYVAPGQDPDAIVVEDSLVMFDDGSVNKFSYSQQSSINLDCSTSGSVTTCQQLIGFFLTSNDQVENDGHFTRGMATFNLTLPAVDTTLLVQDCLALPTIRGGAERVPISAAADLPFTIRIDATDRDGNISTWPVELPAVVQPNQFVCQGDECLCCFLANNVISGVCKGKPGLLGSCGG
jgi:hypothetical protein